MTERRCLFCRHVRTDEDNPAATEREFQMRFGPEAALAVWCGHPEHQRQLNTLYCCVHWEHPTAERERQANRHFRGPEGEGLPWMTTDGLLHGVYAVTQVFAIVMIAREIWG